MAAMKRMLKSSISSFVSNKTACQIVFYIFIGVLVFGFYFTSLPSSRHSSLVRVFLFLSLAFALGRTFLFYKEGKKQKLIDIFLRDRILFFLVFALFVYFMVRSVIPIPTSEFRRVLVLAMFFALVFWYVYEIRIGGEPIVYALGFFGVAVSLVYLLGYFDYVLSHDVVFSKRISGTGFSWLASYKNTIIAGLFYSFLLVAIMSCFVIVANQIALTLLFVGFWVLLFAVFNTEARTAWVAVFISLTSLVFYCNGLRRLRALFLALPVFVFGAMYFLFKPDAVVRKGLTYRDDIWMAHIERINGAMEWAFGKGLSANTSFYVLPGGKVAAHTHSIYIETFYLGGLVGLLLLVLFLFYLLYRLCKIKRKNIVSVFSFSLLSGVVVAMVFDFSGLFYSPNLLWIWLWLPCALGLSSICSDSRMQLA